MTPTNTPNRGEPPEDLTAEVPEADAAEQATPAISEATHTGDTDDGGHSALPPDQPAEADPADAWEQTLPVPAEDDDDYDHDGAADSRHH